MRPPEKQPPSGLSWTLPTIRRRLMIMMMPGKIVKAVEKVTAERMTAMEEQVTSVIIQIREAESPAGIA